MKIIRKIRDRIHKNRFVRISIYSLILLFALNGFLLTFAFIGMKLHLFNQSGAVDYNDRFFQEMENSYGDLPDDTSANQVSRIAKLYYKLHIINQYYPNNAKLIEDAFAVHRDIELAERMVEAVRYEMSDSTGFNNAMFRSEQFFSFRAERPAKNYNIFEWMNIPEWSDFKLAVVKDSSVIDSAASAIGVEPRLIVSVLLGEQMRLFNSSREMYKKVISPLKILSVEANFSLGVTGVKPETAALAEHYLKDSTSAFYPGKQYKHLLDFTTGEIDKERYDRLVDYRNHYYSYLYAGVILKEIREQWKKAGYDISNRPEILATLYNVGFVASQPKADPSVGGSHINVNGKVYTFGALAFEFYYSGELSEVFPYYPDYWEHHSENMKVVN